MSNTDTGINFIEDGSKSDAYRSDEITLGYLPEGFKLEKSDTRNGRVYLLFRNNEKELEFSLREVNFALSIDTENSIVKKLKINENEALYSTQLCCYCHMRQ